MTSAHDPAAASARDRRILDVVRSLAPGEVVSYGDVADDAGYPGRSRLVGTLLATTDEAVPWWRVVTAAGRLVPGLERDHADRLSAEGIVVRGTRVVSAPTGRFSRRPPSP